MDFIADLHIILIARAQMSPLILLHTIKSIIKKHMRSFMIAFNIPAQMAYPFEKIVT